MDKKKHSEKDVKKYSEKDVNELRLIRERNCNLAYQIKEDLLNESDVRDFCANNPKGEVQFFARNYLLQKTSRIKTRPLLVDSQVVQNNEQNGMCPEIYNYFVRLVFNHIRNNTDTFEYCTITVHYQMNDDDSDGLKSVNITSKFERHQKNRK